MACQNNGTLRTHKHQYTYTTHKLRYTYNTQTPRYTYTTQTPRYTYNTQIPRHTYNIQTLKLNWQTDNQKASGKHTHTQHTITKQHTTQLYLQHSTYTDRWRKSVPMSGGSQEVETAMHSGVRHDGAVDTRLCVQVLIVLTVYEICDWLPAAPTQPTTEFSTLRPMRITTKCDGNGTCCAHSTEQSINGMVNRTHHAKSIV